MSKIPDVDPQGLKIVSKVFEKYQDKNRATNEDTDHLSRAQQDLHKLITYFENVQDN